ncbi:class I SAM-dependent methyltransferase [Iningainema tapete]|uniref:Class I SAM-dependent methyltransferase n=1 Tax=Iningainema tapete BLCC-T55 TaxID=2748662 RepID=A0A8J6XFF1_9CYAN|nr:class I SAM-dependent methyltransferase [Iningainema tapete]MBD2774699.1 class I SAM-dependent methyltransferase [Iningainema tapete BLCC-T55]
MNSDALEQARITWNEIDISQVRQVGWYSISYFGKKLAMRFSGTETCVPFIHNLLAQRLPGARLNNLQGAAIVCGDMQAEKDFFEEHQFVKFTKVDGYDLSEVSLNRYTPDKNINFTAHVIDCNDLILEPESYDLIVGCHGIHHVYNLGNAFYQAHKALNQGGLIYLDEWIGLEYLQIPLINHIFAAILLFLLFPSHKTRTTHMGKTKGWWIQYTAKEFDPSEACNSQELLTQFLKYFKPIRIVMYGGLSYPVFEGIAQNIDQTKLLNKIKIRIVYFSERILTKLGIIKPCFMLVLAEKRQIEGIR